MKQLFFISMCFFMLVETNLGQSDPVQIVLQVKEDSYRTFYGDTISSLERKGAEQIAVRMGQYFPFIRFTSNTSGQKLIFIIDREQTGIENPMIHRVDIFILYQNSEGVTSEKLPFEFRSEDRFDEPLPPTADAFLIELNNVLDFWLDSEQEMITRDMISLISLAKDALPDADNQCWIMPFSEDSLQIGTDSEFLVKSKLVTTDFERDLKYQAVAAGRVQPTSLLYPEAYRGKILAELKQEDISKLQWMAHNSLQIEGVYILKFIRVIIPDSFGPDDFELIDIE